MSLLIHGSPLSPFTRKVTLTAMEKGLSFESRDLNPYAPPEKFQTLSPLKQIPVLQDESLTLADSSAICGYFECKFEDAVKLYPQSPAAYGHALWIEEYADTALFSDVSEGVFRPIFINQFLGKPVNRGIVEKALAEDLPRRLSYLEAQIEGRTWFAGDSLSVADLSVYAQMVNLQHAGHLPSAQTYPSLLDHFTRVQARPAASSLYKSEQAYLAKMLKMIARRQG